MILDSRRAIHAVACFEAVKGLLSLCVASGLLLLVHKDLHEIAVRLVEHAHLNPAAKYPRIFLDAAAHVGDSRVVLLALGAAAYSLVRVVEAYGLFLNRAWAKVLAAASGAIYVPFELIELVRHSNWLNLALTVINVAVVAVMVRALLHRRKLREDL